MNWKQKLEQQATPKQLEYIFKLSKTKYTKEQLTIKGASILISKLLAPKKNELEAMRYGK